jgi:hypothetical protein
MVRAYRILLGIYPADYRALFAEEKSHVFEKAYEEYRDRGWSETVRFAIGETIGLLVGAGGEWAAKLTTDRSHRGRYLPDLRMMRPPGVSKELWFSGAGMSVGQSALADEVAGEVMAAQRRIAILVSRTVHAIANHDYPGARTYYREESEARENLRRLQGKHTIDE